jgi:uncharacterized protein YaiI (UPF0178 family)
VQIWVDADACPQVVRQILFKASARTGIKLTFVANHAIAVPALSHITCLQVSQGFDVADDEIVRRCEPGDVIVSSDIPLVAEVIEKGAYAISPRGDEFTKADIRARLNIRDFMDTMRSSGVHSGGQNAYSQKDKQAFANALDRILAQAK